MPAPRCPRRWAWRWRAIWPAASEHVIALAGDAAFTNGISFEALNNIAEQTKRLIVVLNDNEWSIDRNVGRDLPNISTRSSPTSTQPAARERRAACWQKSAARAR